MVGLVRRILVLSNVTFYTLSSSSSELFSLPSGLYCLPLKKLALQIDLR